MAALDWRDARQYDRTRTLSCRWCGHPTPLRDEQRRPAHKVCAEAATNNNDGGPLCQETGPPPIQHRSRELETPA